MVLLFFSAALAVVGHVILVAFLINVLVIDVVDFANVTTVVVDVVVVIIVVVSDVVGVVKQQ